MPATRLLLVACVLISTACSNTALMLANGVAQFDDDKLVQNLPYGPHPANRLDIYRPNGAVKGVVIFFYGGCWGACTTLGREKYRFVAQALTSRGYLVVIPDYRLYPDVLFPQIMADSAAVVKWTSGNIANFGGSADRIFLMGHSAGGHIAAMLAVNEHYLGPKLHQNIRGFIGLAGAYGFIFDKPYMDKLFAGLEFRETQPSQFVGGGDPPLLLLYGDGDKVVHKRNIVRMTDAARKNGGMVEPHIYAGIDHVDIIGAFSVLHSRHDLVMDHIEGFIKRRVKP